MLRSDILNKLDVPGGEDWFSKERFSEKAAYQSLKAVTGFIKLYKENKENHGVLSSWQYKQAIVCLANLESHRFPEAYHSLWDLVSDQEKGMEQLNQTEVLTIYLIIQYFICQLEFCGTQRRETGKKDMNGVDVCEGDIIESQYSGVRMEIKYGVFTAYCPGDRSFMDSVGFYAETSGYPPMPIGPLEEYAKVIGTIFENPELLDEGRL